MGNVPVFHLMPASELAVRVASAVFALLMLTSLGYASRGSGTATHKPTPSPLPSQTIIAYPTRDGTVRWVTSSGTSTWQVTEYGISTRVQSRRDSTKVAVVWTDFVSKNPVVIRGEEPVTYPVRIYNDEWPDGIEVTAYRRVAISGLTGDRGSVIVTPNGVDLDLQLRGAATVPQLVQRGFDVAARAGFTTHEVFPQFQMDMLQGTSGVDDWLKNADDVATEDLNQPVMISDPMLAFAVYVEPRAQANFDREGNIMLMGYAPFVDAIPLTPELYDDSVGTSSGRTTKLTKDRQVLWSTYVGPSGSAIYDNDNNAYRIGASPIRSSRSSGTYQEAPKGGLDCSITKWSAEGRLLWRTYVGGTLDETPHKATVDEQGNLYIACRTMSTDFPTTEGLIRTKQNWLESEDMAIFSLTPDGKTLRWSTYWCGRTEFKPDPTIPGRSYYMSFGDLLYDGHGGVILAFSQDGNPSLPVTEGAWQMANKGAAEGLVTRFRTDGTVAWSTLIASTAHDLIRWLAVDNDTLIRVHFYEDYEQDADYERLPAIGVPGKALTDEGMWGFVIQFGLSGQAHILWAPFEYYNDEIPYYEVGSDVFSLTPGRAVEPVNSPNAIIHHPNALGRSGTSPYYSLVRTKDWVTFEAVYTTPVLGVFKASMSEYNGYLLFLDNTYPSRGACLTDTLWGSGFGTNEDQRPYLVLVKPHPVIISVNDQESDLTSPDRFSAHVYPNPATDHVTITCPEVITDIVIHDVSGRTLVTRHSNGSETTHVDVSTLPSGIYPTMITTSQGRTWSVIIIH
jgi:hypothetical protein